MITNDERLDVRRIADFIDEQSPLVNRYREALAKRAAEFEFNIFNVISDTYYRENLHSDILGMFLDPQGAHNERTKYLDLFLRFLVTNGVSCDLRHYSDATVTREAGRVDLLIKGDKRAIIIENKINDAKDQAEQLPRYFTYVSDKHLECDAIVYLRLSDHTLPDTTTWKKKAQEVEKSLKVMCFYDGTDKDLLKGWIRKCEKESQNSDVRLVLKHYGDLIEKLGVDRMSEPIMNEFYEMMKEEGKFTTAMSLREMLDRLVATRVRKIVERFSQDVGCGLFRYVVPTRSENYVQFYIAKEGGPRVDIGVEAECYRFYFWVNEGIKNAAEDILNETEYLPQFEQVQDGKWRHKKSFRFPTEEHELYRYIRDFNQKLAEDASRSNAR